MTVVCFFDYVVCLFDYVVCLLKKAYHMVGIHPQYSSNLNTSLQLVTHLFISLNVKSYKFMSTYFCWRQNMLALVISWILCAILTATDVFPNDPSKLSYRARTDAKLDVLHDASWFFLPYPGITHFHHNRAIFFCRSMMNIYFYWSYFVIHAKGLSKNVNIFTSVQTVR